MKSASSRVSSTPGDESFRPADCERSSSTTLSSSAAGAMGAGARRPMIMRSESVDCMACAPLESEAESVVETSAPNASRHRGRAKLIFTYSSIEVSYPDERSGRREVVQERTPCATLHYDRILTGCKPLMRDPMAQIRCSHTWKAKMPSKPAQTARPETNGSENHTSARRWKVRKYGVPKKPVPCQRMSVARHGRMSHVHVGRRDDGRLIEPW